MKNFWIVLVVSFFSTTLLAQEKEIKLTGKPIVTIFSNYQAGIGDANKTSGFELERSYLGYQFKLNDELGGAVVFDIGTPNSNADLERVAYVKNAYLSWTPGDFTLNFGLVKLEQFSVQESFWGYRYIMKSFNDEFKFGSSADMGMIGKYKLNSWLLADVTFINGEGYKKLNRDNKYRYGAGVTVKPLKDLTLRAYYDMYNPADDDLEDQKSLALFAGYKHSKFSVGGEYNKMYNTKFVKDNDREGYSAYGKVTALKEYAFFGRYDYIKTPNNREGSDNGNVIIAGVEYRPLKELKLSPNIRTWNPKNGSSETYFTLNLEFKL